MIAVAAFEKICLSDTVWRKLVREVTSYGSTVGTWDHLKVGGYAQEHSDRLVSILAFNGSFASLITMITCCTIFNSISWALKFRPFGFKMKTGLASYLRPHRLFFFLWLLTQHYVSSEHSRNTLARILPYLALSSFRFLIVLIRLLLTSHFIFQLNL